MKTTQGILNAIRRGENGESIAVLESSQQALNAVYDENAKALRFTTAGSVVVGADGSKLGVYNPVYSYAINDITTESGVIYICILANTPAAPKSPSLNPDYWKPYLDTLNQSLSLGNRLFLDDSNSDIATYYVLSESPRGGTEVENSVIVNNNSLLIEAYATGFSGLGVSSIPSDLWVFDIWCSASSTVGTSEILIDVYKRATGGTETLLFSVTTGDINSTIAQLTQITSVQDAFAVDPTDRLVVKFTGQTSRVIDTTITLYHNGTSHYSLIETPSLLTHNSIPEKQGGTSGEYYHLTSSEYSGLHTHDNKTELDLITDGDHDVRTDNPHATDIGNLGSGTLSELNTALSDATLIDTDDSRLSDARTPTAHALSHTDGSDDIVSATASQKGLMTTEYAGKLDGIESGATADQSDSEILTAIKNVDGTDSGLDADLLDGQHATAFSLTSHNHDSEYADITHASQHTNGTDDIQSATASQKGLATATQITKLDAIESGAKANWHPITDFTATPASTSTLTMTSDLTGTINPGIGLKYTIGGIDYYGIITALTSSLMTIAGAVLSGSVTALSWTHIKPVILEFGITGEFADGADSALLANDLLIKGGYKWTGGKAYLVSLAISTFQDDSGATTQPAVNISIASSDVLSTALTIPDGIYIQSVVEITTANYDINYGEVIELSVSAASGGTPGNDAKDLFAILTFIPEMP